MPGAAFTGGGKPYLKIIGGQIAQNSKEGAVGAVERKYETKDGKTGVKWEIPFLNWSGRILGITFKTTEYGESCNIELDDAFLQMGTDGKYFKDFACKVFNADLSKPLLFHPFDMEVDDKKRTGISLQQNGVKLQSYFYDKALKRNINGFPEVDEDKAKRKPKTYWKVYFAEVTEFLIDKVKELKFDAQAEAALKTFSPDGNGELEDLPF